MRTKSDMLKFIYWRAMLVFCRIRPQGRICISTYYTGDCRRIATRIRLNGDHEDLQRADLIRVASAEVNVGNDYKVNIIVTGAPEALRGTAILTELENALEYPTVRSNIHEHHLQIKRNHHYNRQP